ncbi:MAG: ATP synthase F1 subunit gamma [Rickettsiaceae bacterium]|nr:ATP synthase F1 subunit gamma [Rickettsiaceae bacterium]
MSNLKVLRSRIKSIKSTQKITKAMKMIAVSKLNKAKHKLKFAIDYRAKISELLMYVRNTIEIEKGTLLSKILSENNNASENTIIIIYGSDRGLCGGYNYNIVKKLKGEMVKYINPQIICIGKKIGSLVAKHVKPALVINASENPVELLDKVKDYIIPVISSENSCNILMLFTKFVNTIKLEPMSLNLIPLENSDVKYVDKPLDFEGENLQAILAQKYIEANILATLYQSLASNYASSMTAMDNASKNAGNMIEQLTLEQNITRQSIITNELIEVIAGAGAV